MVTRMALLGTTAVASLMVAGCFNNGNGGTAATAALVDGPLGTSVGVPDAAISSDVVNGVADDKVFVTFNVDDDPTSLTGFTVDIELPDGTVLSLTEDDFEVDSEADRDINGWPVLTASANTSTMGTPGHGVGVIVGFGRPSDLTEPLSGDPLFAVTGVGPAEYEAGGDGDDFTPEVYALIGDETETLPEGKATHVGEVYATIYTNDEVLSFTEGDITIDTNFDTASAVAVLSGSYDLPVDAYEEAGLVVILEEARNWSLHADNVVIDSALYSGVIGGEGSTLSVPTASETVTVLDQSVVLYNGLETVDMTGELAGAFFGPDAEATAGVLAADGTGVEVPSVDIVGGYAAYTNESPPYPQ